MIFKQRKTRLANGEVVRLGDVVEFINSDGEVCRDTIKRNVNKPFNLYFWNNNFLLSDYKSARKVKDCS